MTQANWRWCFIINIPIAVISHIVIFFLLRKELIGPQDQIIQVDDGSVVGVKRKGLRQKLSIVDYMGMTLFISSICLIILSITWGGVTYSWVSVHVLIPLVLGGILFIIFWFWEYLMGPGKVISRMFNRQAPMIPLKLFKDRDICILTYLNFCTGTGEYSIFADTIFFQLTELA